MENKQKDPRSTESNLDPNAGDRAQDRPKGMPLHTRILIGLGVGLVMGIAANYFIGGSDPRVTWLISNITEPIGTLFLRLLLMIVIPLVFSSLVVGVAGVGDVRKLGRIGLKSFGKTLVLSAISVAIGLTLANTIRPGKRIDPATATELQQKYSTQATSTVNAAKSAGTGTDSPLMQVVKTVVPSNPMNALASETPNMLHLMFFALMIGIAITLIPAATAAPLIRGLEAIYEVTA
jgi:dicarboxylate/amino acid:cation (Na+ or H+) symporter, DAACS family